MLIMSAVAVFTCHLSSHPFQTRRIDLQESVKIGRSVAKARPAPENAIFDCKVLSRNHALLYYDKETGKFCLQDTKSSNGTFVNNQRLTEDDGGNPEMEVRSGDIVQFGVDVVDTSKRVVVTHGRIVAQLTLYNPDGSEAVRSTPLPLVPSKNESPPGGGGNNNIVSQQLFQLSCWLKEALYREQMLSQKLSTLQSLVSSTQDASESSWQALIDEDRLISRLEVLENQLRAYSKANSEESIRVELAKVQEDKHMYEKTAKESLKKALEEKLDASQKYADMELQLATAREECSHLTQQVDNQNNEQKTLLEKYSSAKEEMQQLTEQVADLERRHLEEIEEMREDRAALEGRISNMEEKEGEFTTRMKSLQKGAVTKESDASSEVISSADSVKTMKPSRTYTILSTVNGDHQPEERRDEGDGAEHTDAKPTMNGDEVAVDVPPSGSSNQTTGSSDSYDEKADDSDASTPESEVPISTKTEELEKLKAKVTEMEEELQESSERADEAEQELAEAQMESIQYIATIEELQTEVRELKQANSVSPKASGPVMQDSSPGTKESIEMSNLGIPAELTLIQDDVDKEYIAQLEQKHCEQLAQEHKQVESFRVSYNLKEELEKMQKSQIETLEQEIAELQKSQRRLENERDSTENNLENMKTEKDKLVDETKHLKEQIAKSITSAKDAKKEIMELRDQLKLEKQAGKSRDTTVQHAEDLLSREKRISLERRKKVEELEKTQNLTMKTTKIMEKEVEKLKEQNAKLHKDLEREKFLRSESEKKLKSSRKGPELKKAQRRDSDTRKVAEIEPVMVVREQQILQSRIPVTDAPKSSGNHISMNQDSSSDVSGLKDPNASLDWLREHFDRLSDDLTKLKDRLHEAETKAPSDRQGTRLKTELVKSQEEIERILGSCLTNGERDMLLRELCCLRSGTIAGIPITNLPAIVIGIAIAAAVVQVALAFWAGE